VPVVGAAGVDADWTVLETSVSRFATLDSAWRTVLAVGRSARLGAWELV
jgi:hypothetical protein